MNRRHGLACLVAACVLVAFQATAAEEPQRGSLTRGFTDLESTMTPSHEMGRSDNELPGSRLTFENLAPLHGDAKLYEFDGTLWDGFESTSATLDVRSGGAVVIGFPGAARWINEIELRASDGPVIEVDGLLPNGEWREDIGRIDTQESGDGIGTKIAAVEGTRYQGIRLRIPRGAASTAEFVIADMGMYWFEEEMAKDGKEAGGEWCENYATSPLTSPSETVGRFLDYLGDHGWAINFEYGNDLAWEEDFKRHDLGGTNGSYVDAVDHIIYCGHGTTDATSMSRTDRDDANVTATDISGAWDGDLEWGWFHCCLNMSSTAWAGALANCHTISGSVNVINGSTNWGKTIAQKLDSTWFFDPAYTIWQAWEHSCEVNQPAGNTFRMVAEDYAHYNEYMWGEGDTEPDSDDSTHWTTTCTGKKDRASAQIFYGKPSYPDTEPVLWEAPVGLGEPGRPALRVLVRPEVLTKKFRQEVAYFDVDPIQMNEGTVADKFVAACERLGLDSSNLASGREDESSYAAASGLASMTGFAPSGGWMFTNHETRVIPGEPPDQMVSPAEAEEIALGFLQSLGLVESNHFVADVRTDLVSEMEGSQVLREYAFAHDVMIGRAIGPAGEQMPMVGPGGRIHVSVGADRTVQAFNHTSRRLTLGGYLEPIPVQTALDYLSAFGYAAMQAAPEFQAFEVIVNDANLGYYEKGILDSQDRLGPVYYMDVTLKGDSGQPGAAIIEVPGRIYLEADAPPVRAQIIDPGDGSPFPYGSEITFTGRALDGVGPYQYNWFSSTQGLISTASTFSTTELMPVIRVPGEVDPITVELKVIDANGYTSSDQISVVITGITGVDDDLPMPFALRQNTPNPFNPRTTIAFSLAEAGEVDLTIFDLHGRVVRTLFRGAIGAGPQSRIWDATNDAGRPVPAGVYVYRLRHETAGGATRVDERKMVLVK